MFLPLPKKTSEEASAAAAHILDAISILESDAASAALHLQQLVAHLNDHTRRSTILALPHAGCIKEAAAASAFYSHQSSQAILDFIARHFPPILFQPHALFSLLHICHCLHIFCYVIFHQQYSDYPVASFSLSYQELLVLARPLKETAEIVKTLFDPPLPHPADCALSDFCIRIKQSLNRFEVYADQVLAVPEAEP